MGIYSDNALEYWEYGLNPLPVKPGTKACYIKKSNEIFFNQFQSEDVLNKYINENGDWDIGIVCGNTSGVIGLDFDFVGDKASDLESMIWGILPKSQVGKRGNKGWTYFYKYNDTVKTTHIKRDGAGFVDVISDGKFTVIPPSICKEGNYEWITDDTFPSFDKDDLPEILPWHINEIKKIADMNLDELPLEFHTNNSPRHTQLLIKTCVEADRAKNVDELSAVILKYDHDQFGTHEKGSYFQDPKYGKGNPEAACKKFVTKIVDWKATKKKAEGLEWSIGKSSDGYWHEGKPSGRYVDFKDYFDNNFYSAKLDMFSDTCMYKRFPADKWRPIENDIKAIQSMCSEVGLVMGKVDPHLAKWILEKKPCLLIKPKTWDRKDYIGYVLDKFIVSGIDKRLFDELMREWMGLIFSRAMDPDIQNKFVILRGKQGIGKDTIIRKLFKGFDNYFSEVSITNNKVENYKSIRGLMLCHIAEFDETNTTSIGILKSLITARDAHFRDSYARKAETYTLRSSFISSANFKHLLRDSSGNRRYMIFDIDDIKWGFNDPMYSSEGILAQAWHYHKANYKASDEAHRAMDKIIRGETPDDPEELFIEEVDALLKWTQRDISKSIMNPDIKGRESYLNDSKIRWPMISESVEKIARKYGYKYQRINQILIAAGFKDRDSNTNYYKNK